MKDFFYNNSSLSRSSESYIVRDADDFLITAIKAKKLSCVYSARGMGKTSLLKRTSERLKKEGFLCVEINANEYITPLEEDWYYTILDEICSYADLKKDSFSDKDFELEKWWNNEKNNTPAEKFIDFFTEKLSNNIKDLIIFIDEIDICLELMKKKQFYFHDFFTAIRHFYIERANRKGLEKINFAFFGVEELYNYFIDADDNDYEQKGFAEIEAIQLSNFSLNELKAIFRKGFELDANNADTWLENVYDCTKGQPFLTQTLCLEIASKMELGEINGVDNEKIKGIVEKTKYEIFFDIPCNHLKYIEEELLNHPNSLQLIEYYASVHYKNGDYKIVYENVDDDTINSLQLLGLIVKKDGKQDINNSIYEDYFNTAWYDNYFRQQCLFGDEVTAWRNSKEHKKDLLKGKELTEAIKWKNLIYTRTTSYQNRFVDESVAKENKRKNWIEIKRIVSRFKYSLIIIIILFLVLQVIHVRSDQESEKEKIQLIDTIANLTYNNKLLTDSMSILQKRLDSSVVEKNELQAKISSLDAKINLNKGKIDSLNKDIRNLEQVNSALKSENTSIKKLLEDYSVNINYKYERDSLDRLLRTTINTIRFITTEPKSQSAIEYYQTFEREFNEITIPISAELIYLDAEELMQKEKELKDKTNVEYQSQGVDLIIFIKSDDQTDIKLFSSYTSRNGAFGVIPTNYRPEEIAEIIASRLKLLK